MERNDPRLQSAIRTVMDWMRGQMYDTEWTHGNEHDKMRVAYDFLTQLCANVEIPRTCANCAHEESCEWAIEDPITNPEEWECSRFRASERALAAARNGAPKGGEHSGGVRAV